MTTVATSFTIGRANGVTRHYTSHSKPEIDVYKEYQQKLLPYNKAWMKNAVPTPKNITIGNNDIIEKSLQLLPQSLEEAACPLEISISESCGRFLKATRDITPGEVLLVEPAIVLATRPNSSAHCSTCFKITNDFKCPDCGFFFCGPDCLTIEHKEECTILRRLGTGETEEDMNKENKLTAERLSHIPVEKRAEAQALLLRAKMALNEQKHQEILQQYGIMAALRTLLKVSKCDFTKNLVLAMQANLDIHGERYKMNQKLIIDVIVSRLKASVDSDLLHQICSVWDTNAFQVVMPQNGRVQGIYPFAGLFNHDCKPNAQQWFTRRGEMVLRAVDYIAKGEQIALSYTDPQWCTIVRQNHLQKCKQFTCKCKRCFDPTEYGTFLGSLICSKCQCPMVSSDPLNTEAPWVCTSVECSESIQAVQILSLGTKIGVFSQKMNPNDVASVLTLTKVLHKQLHPNHFSLQQLYVPVINTLVSKDLAELSDEEVLRFSGMTAQVMRVIRVLQAPLARVTATMAREDLRLQLEALRRKKRTGEDIRDKLRDLSTHLKECIQVLDWDTSTMPSSLPLKNIYEDLINAS